MTALTDFLTHHRTGCLANLGHGCTCGLNDARTEAQKLQVENDFMSAQIDELNKEQPCGHLQRWLVKSKATQYCALCAAIDPETLREMADAVYENLGEGDKFSITAYDVVMRLRQKANQQKAQS